MSVILNDIHLPLLIKSTLSENHQYKTLPWNNLDQLSCLWAVFTKYKRNIRDGFRLENLSWRLWYRQSVLQKKVEPKTSEDIDYSTTNATATTDNKQLTRTRSLPNLSQWSQQKQLLNKSDHNMNMKQKFFITTTDDTQEVEEEDAEDAIEEEEEQQQEQLLFTKKTTKFNGFSSTASSALSKPVSLLTDMLQRTESNVSLVTNSGLRRCQSRYCRLDQFFLNAA